MHPTALNKSSFPKGRTVAAAKTRMAAAAHTGARGEVATLPADHRLMVPLSRLYLSPNNVRASQAPSAEGLQRLASMIEADGLLADLHVSAELRGGKPTGRFGVEAGGRRWRALGLLVAAGKLHADAPISCRAVAEGAATAVSLSENLGFEAMSVVDEFHAFAKLAAEGKPVEAIAARFGVTVVHVQRRMRLAAVAPALLALYRDGEATLDQMMALACVDDPKRQLAAWKSLPNYSSGSLE